MKIWEVAKLQIFPNFFLFYGDEFFLSIYEEKINNQIKNSEILKLYFDEYDYETAKKHISQNSLFGDVSTLIIKTDKWPQNIDKLIKVLNGNNLYLFFSGEDKKAKTKPFGKNFVRFFKPELKDLIIASNEYLAKQNKTIDIEHLKYLISKIDYRFLFRELDKLMIADKINNETIDKLVFNFSETSFDEVFDTLFENGDYLEKLQFLLGQGVDETQIITAFTRYIKNLYLFHLHIKNIGYQNVSKDALGYQIPPQLENKRKNFASFLKEAQFYEFFKILLSSELEIKSSRDKTAVLFATFIKIKSNFN
jgi:DNA polymerase-3 subunit delta